MKKVKINKLSDQVTQLNAKKAEGRKHYPLGTAGGSLIQSVRTPRASWEGHFQAPLGKRGQPGSASSKTPAHQGLQP